MIMFAGIGIGVVVLAVVLAMFVIGPMMSGSSDEAGSDGGSQVEKAEDGHKKSESKKSSSHGESGKVVYTVKDIVVNPAGTGGSRFLSVSFAFELDSELLASEFESREPLVRDALITILTSKTVAQLTDPRQKEIIRYQIKRRVEKLLGTEDLAAVYYTDFVLQ
jgi:flagellar FliL protein